MASFVFLLSLTLVLVPESVMTKKLIDYDKIGPAGLSLEKQASNNPRNLTMSSSEIVPDLLNTPVNGPFESIVQFEKLLAQEKAKLLSPSTYFNEYGEDIQNEFHNNSRTMTKCLSNIAIVMEAARKRLPWALDMIDATGKPSSGVLRGNDLFVGDFDQCTDVDTGQDFDGQYCTTTVVISNIRNTTLSPKLRFILGLCFPSSCAANDVEHYINTYFQSHLDLSTIALQTHCQERHLSLTTKAKVVICICSIFVTLLVISTFYDTVYKRWWLEERELQKSSFNENGHTATGLDKRYSEHEPIIDPRLQRPKLYSKTVTVEHEISSTFHDTCDKVLMSFSVYTNTTKLFTVSQSQESIDCIHGMRFISMTWIILLHTYGMGNYVYINVRPFSDKVYSDWTFMAIIRSVVAVDTFFAMSGLLLTFVVLKKLTKEEIAPKFFGTFYLHRFLRLTPPYMLILMTYVPLFKYLSDGPFWPQDGIEKDECEDTWWINLLYLNNFAKMDKMCMPWCWYLACDVQFYLVSPLIFLPMALYEWKGLLVPLLFLLGNAICSGVISHEKDLDSAGPFNLSRDVHLINDYTKYYYVKPYTRIGPFVIGMITGFLLFKSQCKARISKLVVILGWMAATAMALAVVYGLYDHVRYQDRPSTDVCALYNALNNIAWGISVCWVIFACANGYGGFVNTFLSWKGFIPLSRLTYCAYLLHPLVIQFYFFSQRKPFYLNHLNMSFVFAAMVAFSYAVAYIAYMTYEIPMVGLEKIMRDRGKRH